MARRAYPILADPIEPITGPFRFFARLGVVLDYFGAVIAYHLEYHFTANRIFFTLLWAAWVYASLYQWERDPDVNTQRLAAALFIIDERARDHWTAAGQQLLALFILYVYLSPVIPAEHKDLPAVRKLLLGAVPETLQDMKTMTEVANGLLVDLAMSFTSTEANQKEMASIISTAQRQTEILDNPYIAACLAASGDDREVKFSDWHTGTMSVFLCLSAPRFPVFNRWLRLVLTAALDEMTDKLKPPPLPVCFMLDELATLGHLPSIENAIGLAAGYGIQLVSVFQDVAQMKDLYKGRWASFIGNSGVRAVFNIDDYDTADYWSKFMGGRIVQTVSEKEDKFGINSGDKSLGETVRPLCSTEELMFDYASGKMLVLAQGAHPVVTERIWYKGDRSLDYLWDDPDADPATIPATGATRIVQPPPMPPEALVIRAAPSPASQPPPPQPRPRMEPPQRKT
jgi:type IV secretory pathway TraG/TraD family ATPase VirD4